MPRPTSLALAFALASIASLTSLASLAGCKKTAAPPPPPPTVAPPPVAPVGPDNAACTLVPQDTVERALGHAVNAGVTVTVPPGAPAMCHYGSAPPPNVDIMLYGDGDDGLRATLKAQTMGPEPVQLQGLGTRAYRNADGTTVGVLAHGKFLVIAGPAHVAEALAATVTPHM